MKKKTKISKKIVSFIMVFITIVTTILTSSVSAYASELDMSDVQSPGLQEYIFSPYSY